MELVSIKWKDACHEMLEHSIEDLGGLAELHEVGWLIKETPESVTICLEYQEGMTTARLWLTIPRVNIIELRRCSPEHAFPDSTIDHSYDLRRAPAKRKTRRITTKPLALDPSVLFTTDPIPTTP